MDTLRILWLDHNECVLFNSFEKRVSGRCPAFVGRIAEKVSSGIAIDQAIVDENIEPVHGDRTRAIIREITGTVMPLELPVGVYEKRFNRTLALCPTSSCNLRCIYCSGTAGEKSNKMMKWSLARKSIDWFFEHCDKEGPYTLQFHGAGEPLLNFDVVKKSVVYAKEKATQKGQSLFTRISTNGVISEDVARWIARNVDHVSISLDGPPEIHNLHRPKASGDDSYDKVIQTIKELEASTVMIRMNTVVTEHNIQHLEEVLNHIRSISSIEEVRLLPVSNCGRCEISSLPEVDHKKFEAAMHRIKPLADSLGIKLLTLIEQVDYFTEYYCGACGFNMCVSPEGNVSTCIEVLEENDPGASEMIVGKFDQEKDTFEIDWDKVSFLRTRTYKNIEGCRECTFRTNCSGSCLVRAARKNGTVMSFDEDQCNMVREILTAHYTEMADESNPEQAAEQKPSLSFEDAIKMGREVIRRFDETNQRKWTVEVAMTELMKQVGDLSKHLMTYEGYYFPDRSHHPNYGASKVKIANELADVMLALIRIADHYQIDLEEAFVSAREAEIGYIESSKQVIP